jgi:hypothetical protein
MLMDSVNMIDVLRSQLEIDKTQKKQESDYLKDTLSLSLLRVKRGIWNIYDVI